MKAFRVRELKLWRKAVVLLLAAGGFTAACADDRGGWFPEAREYLGECAPAAPGFEGGCWWFSFSPAGSVDFTSGDDIAYRGDYRVKANRVAVRSRAHPDLDLSLSASQDTLWLPHGGHAVRSE